jgi:hypothetical protein
LARTVVCLAQPDDTPGAKPQGEGPSFRSIPAHERPLPVAEGKDGRAVLLAFTSSRTLFRWYTDNPETQVWAQTPAGQLFGMLPEDMRVFLNPGGPINVLLEPQDVRTVADLYLGRNVYAAYQSGPATDLLLGAPKNEPVDLLAAVSRAAARHAVIRSATRGLATLDEPAARQWFMIGVSFDDGTPDAAVDAAMRELQATAETVTEDFFMLLRLRPNAEDPAAWFAATEPFYSRDADAGGASGM